MKLNNRWMERHCIFTQSSPYWAYNHRTFVSSQAKNDCNERRPLREMSKESGYITATSSAKFGDFYRKIAALA